MSVIVDLVGLYESVGFSVQANLSNYHFRGYENHELGFTHLFDTNGVACACAGIAFAEIAFFEALCQRAHCCRLPPAICNRGIVGPSRHCWNRLSS